MSQLYVDNIRNRTGGAFGIATCGRSIEALISGTTISRISMKSERFTAGQLWIEATKHREGPPLVYVCMSGKSSMLFTDPEKLLHKLFSLERIVTSLDVRQV